MPLQASNHTPEQRAAAVAAALAPGGTVAAAAAAAQEGRLVHEGQLLPPFEVNVHTLQSWRARDLVKQRRAAVAAVDPAAAVDLLEGRLVELASRRLAHLERRGAKNVATSELTEMARVLREIRALRHVPQRQRPTKKPAQEARASAAAEQLDAWAADAAA